MTFLAVLLLAERRGVQGIGSSLQLNHPAGIEASLDRLDTLVKSGSNRLAINPEDVEAPSPPSGRDSAVLGQRVVAVLDEAGDGIPVDASPTPVRADNAWHVSPELTPPPRSALVTPWSDLVLIVCFAAFLVTPLLMFLVGRTDTQSGLQENRNLAPPPRLGVDPIKTLPGKIEAYYADRFGFRAPLIRAYNRILHQWLEVPSSDAIIGKSGWLFYARESVFDDFFGASLFTPAQLQGWKTYLGQRQAFMAKRHGKFLFVVAPDKNNVYPEMLPPEILAHRGQSRWQQLRQYLRNTGSTVDILDFTDALRAAKSDGLVYYPQDTHWNGRGYFVAYQAMCHYLQRWYPDIVPQTLGKDYAISRLHSGHGEWGLFGMPERNLDYPSDFLVPLGTQTARRAVFPMPAGALPIPESWNVPLLWEGKGRGSVLMFHDSFMRTGPLDRSMVPLSEHFARTLLVGRRPSAQEENRYIDAFQPDVLIEEYVERGLLGVPPPLELAISPEDCAVVENAFDPAGNGSLVVLNGTLTRNGSGFDMAASSDRPVLIFPPLKHQVDAVLYRIRVPEDDVSEVYAMTRNPDWGFHPLRASLAKGDNTILVPVPKGQVEQIRLDPGKKKQNSFIQEVRFLSGCH